MNIFRIGNDINIALSITKNGSAADLSGKSVTLYMTHSRGREKLDDIVISDNTISCIFPGLAQSVLGRYTLTVDVRNDDGSRYLIKDACSAFQLAGRSCVETNEGDDYSISINL